MAHSIEPSSANSGDSQGGWSGANDVQDFSGSGAAM